MQVNRQFQFPTIWKGLAEQMGKALAGLMGKALARPIERQQKPADR
jgi:hypothetical protein